MSGPEDRGLVGTPGGGRKGGVGRGQGGVEMLALMELRLGQGV